MCPNSAFSVAILLAFLESFANKKGVYVNALPNSVFSHKEHVLSSAVTDSFPQEGGSVFAEVYNGGISTSDGHAPPSTRSYEEVVERMNRRREEHARRAQAWEGEKAARGIAEKARNIFGVSKEHATAHEPAGKAIVPKEENTSDVYRNTISECLAGGKIERHAFCEKVDSIAECERVLNGFDQTRSLTKLKFHALTYTVNIDGRFWTASIPLFEVSMLKFLAVLEFSLSELCNYEVDTFQLVLLAFEDAIDPTTVGETMWALRRWQGPHPIREAVETSKRVYYGPPPQYPRLYESAVRLTTMLVRAGSLSMSFPVLARFINLACRSRRICQSVLRKIMRKHLENIRDAAAETSAGSSPKLTEELREILLQLFSSRHERIAKNGGVLLSDWLTRSTRAMVAQQSAR